ncbi:MAG: tryptophan-rich sensory protein [Verrucomicrobiales bacterium]|jgi:tryptophan-rich sensory protein
MLGIGNTWNLMGASWEVLKKDKEILFFPFISGISCLLVLASFAIPIVMSETWRPPAGEAETVHQIVYYGTLFLFYFCNYFVITFFNSAIVACAAIRMSGGDPTIKDGMKAAFSRVHLIAGWALVSATVGLILRMIEGRSRGVGRFVAGLLGMAWTIVSFLVVPAMVIDNKGPIDAFKESTRLLKRTWGEQLVSNFSFGIIFFLLGLPGLALIFLGIALSVKGGANAGMMLGVFASLGVLYFLILSLVQSALHAIFQAALYMYARDGAAPQGFESGVLDGAMSQR